MMKIDIIIISHNGSERLLDTLSALANADYAGCDINYIFIDNASTDDTLSVFKEFETPFPKTALSEPRKGKSYGLNLALGRSDAELIVFVDDDMMVSKQWLQAYLKASQEHPECPVFTGQIRPCWSTPPKKWLIHLAEEGRAYGCSVATRESTFCEYTQAKGGNLLVRRSAIGAIQFDEGGANYGSQKTANGGEDTKFALSVLGSEDVPLWYVSEALSFHYIKPQEMNLKSILSRYVRIGEGRAMRLSSIGQTRKIASSSKVVRTTLKIAPSLCTLQFGKAAVKATKAAMCYGEWRYMKSKQGTIG